MTSSQAKKLYWSLYKIYQRLEKLQGGLPFKSIEGAFIRESMNKILDAMGEMEEKGVI